MDTLTPGMNRAALQQVRGTMATRARPLPKGLWAQRPSLANRAMPTPTMTTTPPRQVLIKGLTRDGKTFRPSDWAERLAGAMSSFRPEGAAGGIGAYIGYSPYCVPNAIGGVKCVIVSEALRDIEPMAWDFVMNFARDNNLQMVDAHVLPDRPV
jgi:hypothetical protein